MIGTLTLRARISTLVLYTVQVRPPRPLYSLPMVDFLLQTPKAKTGSETMIQEEAFSTQIHSPKTDYYSHRLPLSRS